MHSKNFRTWLLAAAALLMSTYFMFELGFFTELWNGDKSGISTVILGLGAYYFGKLGWCIYIHGNHSTRWKFSHDDIVEGFEASQAVMTLGMIGTIIGFIMMLSSFHSVDLGDISSVKQLFTSATSGMSTALYTTLTGLTTHLLLRTGYWIFDRRVSA